MGFFFLSWEDLNTSVDAGSTGRIGCFFDWCFLRSSLNGFSSKDIEDVLSFSYNFSFTSAESAIFYDDFSFCFIRFYELILSKKFIIYKIYIWLNISSDNFNLDK